MSKKQREKVEEEVNFHQSQNRIRASGTSPDPWQGPDSTAPGGGESLYPGQFQSGYDLAQGYPTNTQYPFTGQQAQQGGGSQYEEFVDSTTPNTTFDTRNTTNIAETDTQHLQPGSASLLKVLLQFLAFNSSENWQDFSNDSSHDIILGMKSLAGASSRPSGQHISPHSRPAINIKQEQGVEPSNMEGSPHDGWIDSTTTCRPSPFTSGTDNIYLHNVQNGETLNILN